MGKRKFFIVSLIGHLSLIMVMHHKVNNSVFPKQEEGARNKNNAGNGPC
jgi:hypothetical protein